MLFTSLPFIAFFLIVVVTYYLLPHRYRWQFLLLTSYFFYASFSLKYIFFIALSTIASFYGAQWIEQTEEEKKKKTILTLNILFNLSILFFFKYYNFSSELINSFFKSIGVQQQLPYSRFILTIGISFYTFQVMGYLFDIYYEKRSCEKHIGIYATYISFFPKLVAGPIERSTHFLNQLKARIPFDPANILTGLKMILWGYFKKIVIADNLAVIVDKVYNNVYDYHGMSFIIATILYAFQVYCDFSAYSNIAIGISRMMGFKLLENFDQPYLSRSITEYWRKWHKSLIGWFTDYLYTPLAIHFKKWGKTGILLTVFITFITSGLWHGAALTYIIWGALQAIVLSYEILTKKKRNAILEKISPMFSSVVGMTCTFIFTCFSDIFFRANSISEAFYIVGHLATTSTNVSTTIISGIDNLFFLKCSLLLAFYILISRPVLDLIYRSTEKYHVAKDYLVFQSLIISIWIFGYFGEGNFIYLKF